MVSFFDIILIIWIFTGWQINPISYCCIRSLQLPICLGKCIFYRLVQSWKWLLTIKLYTLYYYSCEASLSQCNENANRPMKNVESLIVNNCYIHVKSQLILILLLVRNRWLKKHTNKNCQKIINRNDKQK